MNKLPLGTVSVRLNESEAWRAFDALNGEADAFCLCQLARLVALTAGAVLTRYDVELHPRRGDIGLQVHFYFNATPAQRCEIARALSDHGVDVVETGTCIPADADGAGRPVG